jgi:hypothetical protein
MVAQDDVIWPFKVFTYILPLNWGLRSMMFLEFNDATFSGAELCTESVAEGCLHHLTDSGEEIQPGWRCDDSVSILQCTGRNGDQVLDSLGYNYQSISSEDTVGSDIGICLAIAVVTKICYVFLFRYNCMKSTQLHGADEGKKGSSAVWQERV